MTTYQPLGDGAVLASCSDEGAASRLAAAVRQANPSWLIDQVQAYRTVAVFFDLEATEASSVVALLTRLELLPTPAPKGRIHEIPCCYSLGLDLKRIAEQRQVTPEEVVRWHSATEYTVYAIGFCPGFPYLGYLPEPLSGVPRLPAPRLRVEAGSVGLTGRQTGIYTEVRPGGWNLVGRTPLTLVDVADAYFPLQTGDRVRFLPIDESRFEGLRNQRLTT